MLLEYDHIASSSTKVPMPVMEGGEVFTTAAMAASPRQGGKFDG
jgi:hypothetical protein